MERFNLKTLNDVEVEEEYMLPVLNTFAALGNWMMMMMMMMMWTSIGLWELLR
jgi:hypothetical protein